jgi:nanoRNase/pAp phosphatase (c-di-AMP/oligoRNAs hydrolase)
MPGPDTGIAHVPTVCYCFRNEQTIFLMRIRQKTTHKVERLLSLLRGKTSMLIVMQDYPDPDAIAAGTALRELANTKAEVQCSFAHGGTVGRAENRALVDYLDLNLRSIQDLDIDRFDLIAMVDTQPGTGNNSLPHGIIPNIVIDHHSIRHATRKAEFTDVRGRYGATSTILYEYLVAAKIDIEAHLATALVYGIRSDTQDLGNETTRPDIEAYSALYPIANRRMLEEIISRRVPSAYFKLLLRGISGAQVYGPCIVSNLGDTDNPDMIGEIADLLLRREEIVWALCYGRFKGRMLLSLRTSDPLTNAGRIMRAIVGKYGTGGGHHALAGAQIDLTTLTEREHHFRELVLVRRFLSLTGAKGLPPQPLVPQTDLP